MTKQRIKNKGLMKYFIFWSTILAVFTMLYLLDSKLFETTEVQIQYYPASGDADAAIEKVIISDITEGGKIAEEHSADTFEYDEEKQRWELDGEKEGIYTFILKSWQFLAFKLEYRLNNEEAVITDEKFTVSVYQNEKLVGHNEYPLKHIYDVRLPLSYCQSGLKAIIIFIVLWGCFFAGCVMLYCWFDTCHWKICGFFKKCGKNPYLYIAVFSMAWFAFLAWAAPVNACVGDTTSYYAESFSELSWYYRMPVYQLLLMIVKRLSGVSEWTSAYIYM